MSDAPSSFVARLRRDLGSIESYAAMIGMLVGAGIFRVTGDASQRTGPGVILGYVVLAPAVLASSVAYMVFLSTRLGEGPAAEYGCLRATLPGARVAFLCAWLKMIAYLGALAFLSQTLADYGLEFLRVTSGVELGGERTSMWLALGVLGVFLFVHLRGVRWLGRLQVAMCALLGLSIVVLVVPGIFAVEAANYRPLFPRGATGFFSALPALFFAYAGFESIAHAAGEVRDSTARLPRVVLRGVVVTTVIFVSMSVVAFGVLPQERLAASSAPMAEAAAVYLPTGAASLVALGGVLAVATSVNLTMAIPARIALVLANDRLLPPILGRVDAGRGVPVPALVVTVVLAGLLLVSGQLGLALNIAVFALVLVYLLNSIALLALPSRNPELYASARTGLSLRVQRIAGTASVVGMATLIVLQLIQDFDAMTSAALIERWSSGNFACVELVVMWCALGLLLFPRGYRAAP